MIEVFKLLTGVEVDCNKFFTSATTETERTQQKAG